MLAKLDENGSVFLNCSKGAVGAALVTRFEKRGPLIFIIWSVIERDTITIRFGGQQSDPVMF